MAIVFKDKNGNYITRPKNYSATQEQVQKAIDKRIEDGSIANVIKDAVSDKLTVMRVTQREYDVMSVHNENTLYVIDDTVPYLIFSAEQESWIETDCIPNLNTTYEMSFRTVNPKYKEWYLSNLYTEYIFPFGLSCAGTNASKMYISGVHSAGGYIAATVNTPSIMHTYKRTPTELFLDGESQGTIATGNRIGTNPFVIGNNIVSNTRYRGTFDFFGLKIYENSELIHDYVPAKVGNTPCVYDKVTNKYFYNNGTGSIEYARGEI